MSAGELAARVAEALQGQDAWLVGGTLRDELLGRETEDVDLAVAGDPEQAARSVARALGAPCFPLSAAFGTWRVVGEAWQVDLSVLQGDTLTEDLGRRDFTINAIARPIAGGELIDPHGGRGDLERRVLRTVSDRSFPDDPLRTLRLVRLACELQFSIDTGTRSTAAANASGLSTVAGERIFAEFQRIVASDQARAGLAALSELQLMAAVLPEFEALRGVEQNRYHHLDVYDHTLLVLDRVLELQADPAAVLPGLDQALLERIGALLEEPVGDGVTRATALRLGALLHDIAKPQTQAVSDDGTILGFPDHAAQGAEQVKAICARWKTSDRLRTHLAALARHHLGLGFLVHEDPADARAVYRYLAKTAPLQTDVSLLSIADRLATLGHKAEISTERHMAVAFTVLPQALDFDAFLAAPPLVRGDALARALGIAPGPAIGGLLAQIAEARYAGEITTEGEAVDYVRTL